MGGIYGLFGWNDNIWSELQAGTSGIVSYISKADSQNLLVQGTFEESSDGSLYSIVPPKWISISGNSPISEAEWKSLWCGDGNITISEPISLEISLINREIRLTSVIISSITNDIQVSLTIGDRVISLRSLDGECSDNCISSTNNGGRFLLSSPEELESMQLQLIPKNTTVLQKLQFTQDQIFLSSTDIPNSVECLAPPFDDIKTSQEGSWKRDSDLQIHDVSNSQDSASFTISAKIVETGNYDIFFSVNGCALSGLCALRDFVDVTFKADNKEERTQAVNQRSLNTTQELLFNGNLEKGTTISVSMKRSSQALVSAGGQLVYDGLLIKRIPESTGLGGMALLNTQRSSWKKVDVSDINFRINSNGKPVEANRLKQLREKVSALNGTVEIVLIQENSFIIGGNFTSKNDPSVRNIVSWDGSTSNVNPLGNGVDGAVTDLQDANGKIYVIGKFQAAFNGDETINSPGYIEWNKANLKFESDTFLEGDIKSLSVSSDQVFVAGDFGEIRLPRAIISGEEFAIWLTITIVAVLLIALLTIYCFYYRSRKGKEVDEETQEESKETERTIIRGTSPEMTMTTSPSYNFKDNLDTFGFEPPSDYYVGADIEEKHEDDSEDIVPSDHIALGLEDFEDKNKPTNESKFTNLKENPDENEFFRLDSDEIDDFAPEAQPGFEEDGDKIPKKHHNAESLRQNSFKEENISSDLGKKLENDNREEIKPISGLISPVEDVPNLARTKEAEELDPVDAGSYNQCYKINEEFTPLRDKFTSTYERSFEIMEDDPIYDESNNALSLVSKDQDTNEGESLGSNGSFIVKNVTAVDEDLNDLSPPILYEEESIFDEDFEPVMAVESKPGLSQIPMMEEVSLASLKSSSGSEGEISISIVSTKSNLDFQGHSP